MARYTERYAYDEAGNLLVVRHRSADPAYGGWTRAYRYDEPSLLEPGRRSNRLTATGPARDPSLPRSFGYDEQGNITSMPEIPLMRWDYAGRLHATARHAAADGGPDPQEATYYVYDAAGQRVRKVTQRAATAARKSERIYVGAFEAYREYGPDGAVTLERETLNVSDDRHRLALAETRTVGTDRGPGELIRYQLGNHLDSSVLELDQEAQVISYEEYYPYGSTSYQAVRADIEAPKRYRYTGKERDTETGLYYHGARYCAPWLGRWTSCDPAGLADGTNLYAYVRDNPVRRADPTGYQGHDQDEKPDPDTTDGAPAGRDKPDAVISQRYIKDTGGRGGSSMNMEYLTNGNTAGGATPDYAGELILGAGLSLPGGSPANSAGTVLFSGRVGLFPQAEGGVLLGSDLYAAGTAPPPKLLLGTFHVANKAGNLGIFLQAGGQRDALTGSYTYAGGLNLAGTVTAGKNDEVSIYPNFIYNVAGTGQVSNANVTGYNSATALIGASDTPVQRDDKGNVLLDKEGKPTPSPNTFGAEASITGNFGNGASPGGQGTRSSATATGLIFYQRAFGDTVLGAALGGTYETGGGGWGAFLRIGIGRDWQPSQAPQSPSLVLPTPW
jgi:RHS repeat-associated protein